MNFANKIALSLKKKIENLSATAKGDHSLYFELVGLPGN